MSCVAVFVDAGYLFAQGSAALTGSQKPRRQLQLKGTSVVTELTDVALKKTANSQLLRIYWYDGRAQVRSGMSLEHTTLAHTDFIKLRLGQMNNQGQQKGVDSLIVTDMIELARNKAIGDALLLSGDEDVRVGVQIAQSLGVRVHLLGISPCRGSQSKQLMQEADTTTEWNKKDVEKFLSINPPADTTAPSASNIDVALASLETIAQTVFAELDRDTVQEFNNFRLTNRGLPPEIDRRLLRYAKTTLGRNLEQGEKIQLRAHFVRASQGDGSLA